MPIYDKSINLAAPPGAVGLFIASSLGSTGGIVETLRPGVLYRLNRDGLGYVFLLRPEGAGSMLRLIGHELAEVNEAFRRAPSHRDAMVALTALPPPQDIDEMRLIPHFDRISAQIAARFDPNSAPAQPAPAPSTGPDPQQPAGTTAAARKTTEIPNLVNQPLKQPKTPTRSSGMTILTGALGVAAFLIVATLVFYFVRQAAPAMVPALDAQTYDSLSIRLRLPDGWTKKDFTNVAGCKQLGFTCLIAADGGANSDVSFVLGSTVSPKAAIDLGQLEKDTWAVLQKAQTGLSRISVDYVKVGGSGGVQAIRRFYNFTIPSAVGGRGYAMQVYFNSPSAIFELTVASVDQGVFRAHASEIDSLMASIVVK